ncbi:MAG TPA: hypothetical protein VIL74_20125 [Pyrinomonadaceae bacterium]
MAARLLTPLAPRIPVLSPPSNALDSKVDYLWSALFMSLTHGGVEFEPKIVFRDADRNLRKGALVVSGHFFLNFFVLRWLHDNGYQQSIVSRERFDREKIVGTKNEIDIIKPTPKCLLEVRRRLKAGEVVLICIDNFAPYEGCRKFEVEDRQIYFSDVIFKFAERFDVPLIFVGTQINEQNEVEIFSARPASTKSADSAAEFGEFIKKLLAQSGKKAFEKAARKNK